MNSQRYRMLTGTLEREIPKAFRDTSSFSRSFSRATVTKLRAGSVVATVAMEFQNAGQAPESDAVVITTLQQYISENRGRLGSLSVSQVVGVPTATQDCDPIPFGRCQNMPYSDTSFPNWLGWQGPTEAIGNATAIFGALDQISDCHKDLELFLCSLYFPSCTSTGTKFPCRSFCDEINNACALRALSAGIPWDTAGCTTLPVSSYQEGCIAPEATCDGWPYECYGSPGSCVGAWEFCDGNGFCPYNDDESVCGNYTCMPIELEYCQGEVPYDRTTLLNYFGQQSAMTIEESDIHRNVSLLAETSCHEYVKFVYCHMAVPECIRDGVRGQPLCRTLCEEIRQTCAEEIEEIGFQFDKSTCESIFPDSVQNDTCKLAKEFNCTFDVDTCEWMAGNNSQAAMLQPTSDSDGNYVSLDGTSSKLTSPMMYTDIKCLRMRYFVSGDDSRLSVYVTGPDGNSFSTWRQASTHNRDGMGDDDDEEREWSSINLNINKGWQWFMVSLDAYVAEDGEVGVDDVTLSDGSCEEEEEVSPGCEAMKFDRCLDMPYNFTTYPNVLGWDRDLALSLAPGTFQAFDQIADCHRDLSFYLCSFIFPECTPSGIRLPCRSFCEGVTAACAARANAVGLTWDPNGCQSLSDDRQFCSLPREAQCESIEVEMCRNVVPYNTTTFPNLLSHVSQQSFLTDQDSVNTITALMNSGCHPDVEFAVCSALVPNCVDSMQIPPCRDFCNDVRDSCEQVLMASGQPWPFECNDFTARGRCAAPYPVMVSADLTLLDEVFTEDLNDMNSQRYRMLAGSLEREIPKAFRSASSFGRSFSRATVTNLRAGSVVATVAMEFQNAGQAPESDEVVITTLQQYISENRGRLGSLSVSQVVGVPTATQDCDPIPYGRCQNMPYSDTSFPNWLGWKGPTDAIGNATAIFGALDQISDCHKDLELFLCSLYFPSCTSTGTKFPCRSFCDEINNACALRALSAGIPWDTAGCTTLPVSSYQEGCIAPEATCDGWPYECYGSPGSCVGAWEFCDGNGFCPYNDDESVCGNYTCMPIELEYCQGEVPYDRTTLPNYFGQQSAMTIEESDIHRNVSLLAATSCHESVKFVYCHMAVPECIRGGVRGQPLCRTLCEEIRQTCAEEIEEIGFQFDKSTCESIFPDSVQNDTCKLAKEFNCTFDVGTCEWIAGDSQAAMLQPTSDSNGKYVSLNGASSKLTSPTMYTDNKCLRMRYFVRGESSRLTAYVTGPDGNSFSTWRHVSTYDRDGMGDDEWSSINLNINKGWPWFKVSLDAYVADEGEIGVDDVTLSDGSCESEEEAVSPGCEAMKFERCLDMPYNFTTYPNVLGWDRDLALSLAPGTFQAFDQIADCHSDLSFYLCSFIFPECTPSGIRLPCRSFCEGVTAACAARANAVGLTWDPNGCQSLSDDRQFCSLPREETCPEGHHECFGSGECVGPWQFCDGYPDCPYNDDENEQVCGIYECMPMDFGYCRGVVNYTRAIFPNYYGHQNVTVIEQSEAHQFAVSFANTNCHPDSNLLYCHLVVPECVEDGVRSKPVCRAVCEEMRQECSDETEALQIPGFTKEWCYANFPDSVHNDTCILFKGVNCTFDYDLCNWDQFASDSESQPWIQATSSSRPGKHITSSASSSRLLVSPRIYTDGKCLKFQYMLTGSDNRVLLKLIGPNGGVTLSAWNTTSSRSVNNEWTTASINIRTGLDSVQVAIQAWAEGDGAVSIDNMTLSDGPCREEEKDKCEPIMLDVCQGVVPYTETLFPNLLNHSSQRAFLDDPMNAYAINLLMDSGCHPDIRFAVCSALTPKCVDSKQLPPCRGFCNEIRASCQPVLGMAGQEWPFECEGFPFEFQGECTTPSAAQCEPIEIGMCRNVVPYNTTTFPNLLGHVSQQSFLTTPESVSIITALMNSGCHPNVGFAVCSALVPNCVDSVQIPPCRDFCNDVRDSCEQVLTDHEQPWPFECNDFAVRGRCAAPYPVVFSADLTLPDEVFTADLNDRNTQQYRMIAGTLEREIPKAFRDCQATVRSLRAGSVVATVDMEFQNAGQAPESNEAVIATLQQYIDDKRGRLGSLSVSAVVGVPTVTSPCDENPCGQNGDCEKLDSDFGIASYRCTCQDGFTGYSCEIRIAGRCHESIQSVLRQQGGSLMVGVYLPQCRDDGGYQDMQCHPSTGYCWCVTVDGTEIPGTQTPRWQNRPDCDAAMNVELYPYGPGQGDNIVEFSDLDDGTSDRINIPAGFPFFYTRHARFYICTNGLISFGRRYCSYIPVPFRTGGNRPVIAPFWADHDFRDRNGQSNVFYQEYRGKVVNLPANSAVGGVSGNVAALAANVVNRVVSDVTAYAGLTSGGFDPSWIGVITWSNVTAYPSRSNPDEIVTHQLVLATDGVKSFAIFNYGAMNWQQTWREARSGYTAADSVNFFDSKYSGIPEIFNINQLDGNTGIRGKWFFRLDVSAEGDVNYDQLCLGWADVQDDALLVNYTLDSQPCPCSWAQATRDRRFRAYWDDMCVELRWSSPLGIGQRCCYSDVEDDPEGSGALLLGFPGGGSISLYDPRVYPDQYQAQDILPRSYCCLLSRNCELYYRYRPSDTCERYEPPRWAIGLGDPHLTTLDGKSFTFNGLGEYQVFGVPDVMLVVQGRTRKAVDVNGTETKATIFSAFVAKQGESSTVQMNLKDDASGIDVYVDRQIFGGFADLVVGDGQDFNNVTVSKGGNGSVVTTFSSGIALEVAVDVGIMAITVMAPPKFKGNTKGLLGLWNDDVTDDFTRPDGTSISINASDSDIYYSFGQLWNISESDSIFYYGSQSWSDFANPDPDFVPLLEVQFATEELRLEAEKLCGDNKECLFDTAATGDLMTGASTANAEERFVQDTSLIANFPPKIFGPTVVNATVGKEASFSLTATDINNDTVKFSAQNLPGNARFDNATATFSWTPSQINSLNMSFTASDGKGGTSILRPTVNLCKCENNGTCDFDNLADDQNINSLLRVVACMCGDGLEGTFCEVDIDGCEDDPCYMGVNCTDVPAPGVGYTCSACPEGMEGDGAKCRDVDECTNGTHKCGPKAVCRNELRSYSCECPSGYRLSENKRNCTDIDECADDVSGCTQLCNNTDGGFQCDCYGGFYLNATNNVTCYQDQAARNVCAVSLCENCRAENDVAVCFCSSGYKLAADNITCEDVNECAPGNEDMNRCSQKTNCQNTDRGHTCSCDIGYLLQDDLRTCTTCAKGRYGVNCGEICGCNRGECNVTVGCVCPAGWKGAQCEMDVDECEDDDICMSNETCVNSAGSYQCVCSPGFAADESDACKDVDECDVGHNCHAFATCTNTVGGFSCTCGAGYVGDGVTCEPATTPPPSTTPTQSTPIQSTSAVPSPTRTGTPAVTSKSPTATPTKMSTTPATGSTVQSAASSTEQQTVKSSTPIGITASTPIGITASTPIGITTSTKAPTMTPTKLTQSAASSTAQQTVTSPVQSSTASQTSKPSTQPTPVQSTTSSTRQQTVTTPVQSSPTAQTSKPPTVMQSTTSSTRQQTVTTPVQSSTAAQTSKPPTASQSSPTTQPTPVQSSSSSTRQQPVTSPVQSSTAAQTSKPPTASQSNPTTQPTPDAGSQTAAAPSKASPQPTAPPAETTPAETTPAETTPAPTVSEVSIPTEVTLVRNFTEELNNRTHPVFQELANKVRTEVTKPYQNNPSFQRVVVKGFRPGSVVASFDTVFKNNQAVPDNVEAVALLKQYIDNNNGKLGDLVASQVSYAPPNTTAVPITDCDCAVGVNCVSYGGKCLAFCSPNPDYCLNGGTCMDSSSETLTCQCTSSFTSTYNGDRCENRGTGNVVYAAVGAVAGFLLLLILILVATRTCLKSKSKSQPIADDTVYANRRAMNYAPAGLERGLRSTSAAKYRPSVHESGHGATVVYDFSGKNKASGQNYNNVIYDNVGAAAPQGRPDEGAHVYHNPIHQQERPYQSLVRPQNGGYQQPATSTFTGQKINNVQRNVHVNEFQIPRAKSPYWPATSYSTKNGHDSYL
ncbi:uncharacterized protein [Branchiostoma lanceolatum]|uniref:uncharacterized protein isoform X4 n=1 Tax=Branchiostoma lanceolatum TaxID=7740 RepID=UPI003451F7D4